MSDKSAVVYLRAIQREFLQELPERVVGMESAWESITKPSPPEASPREDLPSREVLEDLRREAHTLRGESATFGFLWISQAAERVESSVKSLIDGSVNGEQPEIARQIRDVQRAYEKYSPDRLPDMPNLVPEDVAESPSGEEKLIFLVEDDESLAKAMAVQLRHYGYEVRVFNQLDDLARQLRESSPSAVVMDIILEEGDMAGADFIRELRGTREKPLHVVFTSVRADMEARLQAYRAGCDAYFTKPVDINALADKLDGLTGRIERRPYEILIVDDDEIVADVYAMTLRRAGMKVTVESDPMKVLDQVETVRPDLILLDVYMPKCDGPELAAVLRQHEIHLSIPIVFLSAESDFDEQVAALVASGGDEFLTKPIEPKHLVAMVLTRAQQGRLVGTMIYQDGLTGLPNRSKLTQQLQIEVKRAAREDIPLTFARLDLEKFKSVNEAYGTHTGDRVLRSLAGILKKRLRQTDTIARYGGDEFAVILPCTTGPDGKKLLEEISSSFAQIGHIVGEEKFTASINCGLATHPSYPNVELLTEAAGNALAEAKRRGKKRVALFD